MNWFERIPKIELHLHLEGAIPHEVLWELIQKYGGDPSVPDIASLRRRFEYKDFSHFIEAWSWKNQFLREYEDFTYIAEAIARDLAAQNIRYVEMFFSPSLFTRNGLRPQKLASAIRTGLQRVPEIDIVLIADLVRNFGPKKEFLILNELKDVKELGVVGVGIGGSEQDFPPEPFKRLYEEARKMGFHTNAHAGEAAGPESIWGAIRSLKAERIGHGTRAEEDELLLDYLVEHQIPLEMCPLSNFRTNVVKAFEDHPVRKYFERGIIVTINTDDPKMFGNSLAEEFYLLNTKLGFSRDEIRHLILQSIRVTWLSENGKQKLIETFCKDPVWQEDTFRDVEE